MTEILGYLRCSGAVFLARFSWRCRGSREGRAADGGTVREHPLLIGCKVLPGGGKAMLKTMTSAAFVLTMATTAPITNAQTAAVSPSPMVRAAMTANHLLAGQIRLSDMSGATVYDVQNRNIGAIKDIVLGADGRVAAVVLHVGGTLGVGGRDVAIGIGDLKIADRDTKPRFSVDMTKEQLGTAQTYDLDKVVASGSSASPGDH
jgi:sporulation protein YlmC with PRC-barrel domain